MKVKIQFPDREPVIFSPDKCAIAVLLEPGDRKFISDAKEPGIMCMCVAPPPDGRPSEVEHVCL